MSSRKHSLLVLVCSVCLLPAQNIVTVAGGGTGGDGPALSAQLTNPAGIAFDTAGTLYFAESLFFGGRLKKLSGGSITTIVSSGLNYPIGVAVDAQGNILVADRENNRIRKVTPGGSMSDFAGSGSKGTDPGGAACTAMRLNTPSGVFVAPNGTVYFAETGSHLIRRVDGSTCNTHAGSSKGFLDGPAATAQFYQPYGMAMDAAGALYVADYYNYRVRKIAGGTVSTFAGSGDPYPASGSYSGDGGAATAARLRNPGAVAVDAQGNVYIADTGNHCVRRVNPAGVITAFAGTCGTSGFAGDGGPATAARLNQPTGLAFDAQGNLFISDSGNARIRKVDLGGAVSQRPQIRSTQPVLQAFGAQEGISSGTWIEIYGSNFSAKTRSWSGSDFTGNRCPTSLEGVRVNVNGKAAFVSYVSPTQVNAQVPDDDAVGPVLVEVVNDAGSSNTVTVQKRKVSPALLTTPLFNVGGKQYIAATYPDYVTFVGRENLIAGVPFRPAKAGDVILLYAVGCGTTNPATPAGQYFNDARPLALPFQVRFGETVANAYGALAPGLVGLCQFNVTVPPLAPGDVRIDVTIDGTPTGQTLWTTVQ